MKSIRDIRIEIESHDCGRREICKDDEPIRLRCGWKCLGCGRRWSVRLDAMQRDVANGDLLLRMRGVMRTDPFSPN